MPQLLLLRVEDDERVDADSALLAVTHAPRNRLPLESLDLLLLRDDRVRKDNVSHVRKMESRKAVFETEQQHLLLH